MGRRYLRVEREGIVRESTKKVFKMVLESGWYNACACDTKGDMGRENFNKIGKKSGKI